MTKIDVASSGLGTVRALRRSTDDERANVIVFILHVYAKNPTQRSYNLEVDEHIYALWHCLARDETFA